MLADIPAIIADCVRDVEGEIWASSLDGYLHNFLVLFLCKMLIQIGMQCGTSVQILRHEFAMQYELVQQVASGIFNLVKITVVMATLQFRSMAVCMLRRILPLQASNGGRL